MSNDNNEVENRTSRHRLVAVAVIAAIVAVLVGLLGGTASADSTTVPGHSSERVDADQNGYPDEGMVVSGNYNDVYSDADGDCDLRVNYRGTFDNDPYLDSGWIQNHYVCRGPDGSTVTYNYLIVHESDPRYKRPGEPIWGTWKIVVFTVGGDGNVVNPNRHVGG